MNIRIARTQNYKTELEKLQKLQIEEKEGVGLFLFASDARNFPRI